MKKLLSYAALSLFVLTVSSCTTEHIDPNLNANNNGNNNGGGSTDNVLLKKEIVTDGEGVTTTYVYTYDGNKVMSVTGTDGSTETYTYSGNVITKREYNDGTGNGHQTDTFFYDANGKLSIFISGVFFTDGTPPSVSRNVYTYNADNTITVKKYYGDEESQTDLHDTAVVTISNGNVVSYVGGEYTETATFDGKNSPLKNTASDSIISLAYLEGGVNNELVNRFVNSVGTQTSTSTYTYNSSNYPVTSTMTISTGESYTAQYFY